jgi:hypothetical protein
MELALMRKFALLCSLLAAGNLAFAQHSQAVGNWQPPGVYAMPNVPLIRTPSVSLDAAPMSAVGASNATAGNVAGATNSTLSSVSLPANRPFATLTWYRPGERPSNAAGTR